MVNRSSIPPVYVEPEPVDDQKEECGFDVLKSVLSLIEGDSTPQYTIFDIKVAVSEVTKISVADIESLSQKTPISYARQLVFYFSRKYTTNSFLAIGKISSNRHYSSVMHGVEKIERLLKTNGKTAKIVAEIHIALGPKEDITNEK